MYDLFSGLKIEKKNEGQSHVKKRKPVYIVAVTIAHVLGSAWLLSVEGQMTQI